MKIHKSTLPKKLLKHIAITEFDKDEFLHGYLDVSFTNKYQCFMSSLSHKVLFEFSFPIFHRITHLIMITNVSVVTGSDKNGVEIFEPHELRFHF